VSVGFECVVSCFYSIAVSIIFVLKPVSVHVFLSPVVFLQPLSQASLVCVDLQGDFFSLDLLEMLNYLLDEDFFRCWWSL